MIVKKGQNIYIMPPKRNHHLSNQQGRKVTSLIQSKEKNWECWYWAFWKRKKHLVNHNDFERGFWRFEKIASFSMEMCTPLGWRNVLFNKTYRESNFNIS